MSLHAVKILGIKITTDSKNDILEYIEKSLNETRIITTPNPEQIVRAQEDTAFAELLSKSDVAIPDGIGVAKVAGVPRIPGVEFMEDLVALAGKKRIRIALIGGFHGVAVEAFECLQAHNPDLQGWAKEPDLDDVGVVARIAKEIRQTRVGMVFVGLGAPKQEDFIAHLAPLAPAIYMSVGGSFDIISGRTPRAPVFIRTIGFEWAWRLVHEPWRWRRQLALIKFMWLVLRFRFFGVG